LPNCTSDGIGLLNDRTHGETTVAEHNDKGSHLDETKPLDDELAAESTQSEPASDSSGLPIAEAPQRGADAQLSETEMADLADSLLTAPVGDAVETAATEGDKPVDDKDSIIIEEKPKEEKKKKGGKTASEAKPKLKEKLRAHQTHLEWAGLAFSFLILLVVAFLGLILFATAIYGFSLIAIAYTLWKGRKANSIYVAMLGLALAALLTGVYCLWIELALYRFDVRAREVRPRLSMSAPATLESGSAVQLDDHQAPKIS